MPYPSDLSDKQWSMIEPIISATKERGFKRKYQSRDMMNAIFYVVKTGCQWRYLPSNFPPRGTVYQFFRGLTDRGIFEKINESLRQEIRIRDKRDPNPSLLCIDSQSIKGDVNLQEKGIDGNKKVNGRKRHIAVDVLGLIVFCIVTSAKTSDIHPAREMLEKTAFQPRVEKILVDKGYKGLEGKCHHFEVQITSKDPDVKGFVPVYKRWVVERTFAWLSPQRRLSKDYESTVENQRSMIFIAMSKLMLNRFSERIT